MVMIRALTPEEIAHVVSKAPTGRPSSPLGVAIRSMVPGEGILVSHQGLKCAINKLGHDCSINTLLTRVRKQSLYDYKGCHTDGQGSDVMVICFAKSVPPPEGDANDR